MKKTFIPKQGFLERKPFSGINCVSGMGGVGTGESGYKSKEGACFHYCPADQLRLMAFT